MSRRDSARHNEDARTAERDKPKVEKKERKEDRDDRPRKSSGLNKALGATDDIDALLGLLVSQDPKRGAMAMEGFERVFGKDRDAIYNKGQQIITSFLTRIETLVRNPPTDPKEKQKAQRNMDAMVRFMYNVTHQKNEPRGEKLLLQELCTQQNLTILSTYVATCAR